MRIDGRSSGQAQGVQSLGDILGRLQAGDIIKAKILEISGGEVLLKMFDGTEFKAATAAKIDARPGDTIELMVSGREDNRLFMETVKKGESSSGDIGAQLKLQLEKLDFKPDNINLDVASSLKAKGLPISKDTIDKAVALMQKFSEISSDKAVFLASKGITPPGKNASMLINLLDGKLKLGKGLDELQQQLISVVGEFAGTDGNTGDSSNGISSRNSGIEGSSVQNTVRQPVQPYTANKSNTAGQGSAYGRLSGSDMQALASGNSGNISDDMLLTQNQADKSQTALQKDNTARLGAKTGNNTDNNISDAAQRLQDILLQKSSEATDITGNNSGLPDKDTLKLQLALQKKGEAVQGDNLKETARAAVKILKEAGELFIKVESDSFKSDIEVKKLLGNIIDRLDSIKELIQSSSLPGRDELLNKLGTVEDNMRLLNNVGNNTMYAQIPVNMQGFNTTAELFVMKREAQRKRIAPGNAVLFLSLDTHNIGTVQSIVEIKGKNVGVNLRAESNEIIDYIKENMTGLYNSLSKNGFKLVDVRYRLISEPAGLADMENVIGEEFKERLKSVDFRI